MFDTLHTQAKTAREELEARVNTQHERVRVQMSQEQQVRAQMKQDLIEHHTGAFEKHKREYESMLRNHSQQRETANRDLQQQFQTEVPAVAVRTAARGSEGAVVWVDVEQEQVCGRVG